MQNLRSLALKVQVHAEEKKINEWEYTTIRNVITNNEITLNCLSSHSSFHWDQGRSRNSINARDSRGGRVRVNAPWLKGCYCILHSELLGVAVTGLAAASCFESMISALTTRWCCSTSGFVNRIPRISAATLWKHKLTWREREREKETYKLWIM